MFEKRNEDIKKYSEKLNSLKMEIRDILAVLIDEMDRPNLMMKISSAIMCAHTVR